MKNNPKADGATAPNHPDVTDRPAQDLHHGDLRKGAFLRRRANYQMQASAASGRQAGDVTQPPAASLPPARKRR